MEIFEILLDIVYLCIIITGGMWLGFTLFLIGYGVRFFMHISNR